MDFKVSSGEFKVKYAAKSRAASQPFSEQLTSCQPDDYQDQHSTIVPLLIIINIFYYTSCFNELRCYFNDNQ